MSKDEIIKMAREAGWEYAEDDRGYEPLWKAMRLAYAAGAAAEREACAKVCDDESMRCESAVERAEPDEVSAIRSTAWKISICAAAIRARGEK